MLERALKSPVLAVLYFVLNLAQVALAVAVIAVVANNLWNSNYYYQDGYGYNGYYNNYYTSTCYLQKGYITGSRSTCYYVYTVAGVSIFFTFIIALFQWFTCFGRPVLIQGTNFVASLCLLVWWLIAAAIITPNVHDADSADVPNESWRHVVVGLAWGEVLVFLLSALLDGYMYWRIKKSVPQIPPPGEVPMTTATTFAPYPPQQPGPGLGGYPPAWQPGVYPAYPAQGYPAGAYPQPYPAR